MSAIGLLIEALKYSKISSSGFIIESKFDILFKM